MYVVHLYTNDEKAVEFQVKKMLLSASANALKLCNIFYDPSISYVDLHILHKRTLPSKFCLTDIVFYYTKFLTIQFQKETGLT